MGRDSSLRTKVFGIAFCTVSIGLSEKRLCASEAARASAEELADASRLIDAQGLPAFCRAIYNANEFVRIE